MKRSAVARIARPYRARGARRIIAGIAIGSVLASGTLLGAVSGANATNYPSYADVVAARASVTATKNEITALNSLLTSLQTTVDTTQKAADDAGAAAQVAQTNLDSKTAQWQSLNAQAEADKAKAAASRQQAGQFAARLAQSGGGDLSATIFFSGSNASALLAQLGLASMVKDQSAGLYSKAIVDERTAKSVTDLATVQKDALAALRDVAQRTLADAATAATAASDALANQQAHQITLNAQLAVLTASTAVTEADYATGVAVAQAAAAAALAASRVAAPPVSVGQITNDGWTRPAAGHMSSPYGYRIDPYTHQYALHEGTDLAPGCGSPIYAAHSGTVEMAGPYGGYGNYIRIRDSDDGSYETAYGHIVNGGILVHVGETVGVGQNIAYVGSTGWSTGCHLHFEIHHNGTTQDPVPFMHSHGVSLDN